MVGANETTGEFVESLETGLAEARRRAECLPEAAKGILRGVGRSTDLRDWLGFRARRDRRRYQHLRRSQGPGRRQGPCRDG
jgi:hypothetical protein